MALLTKFFLRYTHTSKKVKSADEFNLSRGGEVGNLLPLFKVRDQFGKKIISEKIPGKIRKLIFLSDTCGLCFEVLQMLASKPGTQNYLASCGSNFFNKDYGDLFRTKYPNIEVKVTGAWNDVQKVLKEQKPDILVLSYEDYVELMDEGKFLDLNNVIKVMI